MSTKSEPLIRSTMPTKSRTELPVRPSRPLAVPLALLTAAACGGNDGPPQAQTSGPGATARVIPVEIAVAELGTAARTVTATGTVEPIRTVTINSQLAGAVRSVAVEEGDVVRAGTPLARIDSRELEAQLASARATLEVAARAAERAETLRRQEIVTVAEYERDQAEHAAARATHDQL